LLALIEDSSSGSSKRGVLITERGSVKTMRL